MIWELIFISTLIYLVMGSINDIKYRFVHDYMTYSFGLLFLLLRIMLAFESNNISLLINSFYFFIPALIIGVVLYKLGWWGGGDAKMIIALTLAIPFAPGDSQIPYFGNFLMNSLVGGLIFGILYSFILVIRKWRDANKVLKPLDLIITVALFITSIILFYYDILFKLFGVILFFLPISYIIRKLENVIQIIDKKVSVLEPGDWIISDIKVGRHLVVKKPTGLSKEDIKILQKSKLKLIKIRDGIPFVPSFLIGLIFTQIYGNVLINIVYNFFF